MALMLTMDPPAQWSRERLELMTEWLNDPRNNGGYHLPDGQQIAKALLSVPMECWTVFVGGLPTLCLSLAPIDKDNKLGIFHITGDGRLPSVHIHEMVDNFLGFWKDEGYAIGAMCADPVMVRWARQFGFVVTGKNESTGVWEGVYQPHH